MSTPLFIPLPGNGPIASELANALGAQIGALETRDFPDGETYLRFLSDVRGRSVILVCTLARPNDRFLPLVFGAAAARDLGARRVGLVAPYLAYMRQDRRFRNGEAVTSVTFAKLISQNFDWLVTVDPHLHRRKSLTELYTVPARIVNSSPLLAQWIKVHVADPFIIGPDDESLQWISQVARDCGADFTVLHKERRDDREVKILGRNLDLLGDKTPVLLDDIISSGQTMLEAVRLIGAQSARQPVVLAVHGVFADGSNTLLEKAGARVVTTDSIPNPAAAIKLAPILAPAIGDVLAI